MRVSNDFSPSILKGLMDVLSTYTSMRQGDGQWTLSIRTRLMELGIKNGYHPRCINSNGEYAPPGSSVRYDHAWLSKKDGEPLMLAEVELNVGNNAIERVYDFDKLLKTKCPFRLFIGQCPDCTSGYIKSVQFDILNELATRCNQTPVSIFEEYDKFLLVVIEDRNGHKDSITKPSLAYVELVFTDKWERTTDPQFIRVEGNS